MLGMQVSDLRRGSWGGGPVGSGSGKAWLRSRNSKGGLEGVGDAMLQLTPLTGS